MLRLLMYFRIIILFLAVLGYSSTSVAAAKKVALIIGNSDYVEIAPLPNPRNDAKDVAERLQALGFSLHDNKVHQDLGERELLGQLESFATAAEGAEIAFLYFAGHGMQFNGDPHLLPVDIPDASLSIVRREAIGLNEMLSGLTGRAALTIAVFDACREIPNYNRKIKRATRGSGESAWRGLSRPKVLSESTLIAYSGGSGELVADGVGRNSPYTTMLLDNLDKELAEPGQYDVPGFFSEVAYQFRKKNSGQNPEVIIQGVRPHRFYLSDMQAESSTTAVEMGRLTVKVEPGDARVRVMNISDVYEDRIELARGAEYDIFVTRDGYRPWRKIVTLEGSELVVPVVLEPGAHKQGVSANSNMVELEWWNLAREIGSEESYRSYLERYPAGEFSEIANIRLFRLESPGNLQSGQPTLLPNIPKASEQQDIQKLDGADEFLQASDMANKNSVLPLPDHESEAEENLAVPPYLAHIENRPRETPSQLETVVEVPDSATNDSLIKEMKAEEYSLTISSTLRRKVQTGLRQAGFDVGVVDGIWGYKTRQGIMSWQAANGIAQTGYLTKEMLGQLISTLNISQAAAPSVSVIEENVKRNAQASFNVGIEISMEMIEGGQTTMRSGENKSASSRRVRVADFEISKYEVTILQWRRFVEATGFRSSSDSQGCTVWKSSLGKWVREASFSWSNPGFAQSSSSPVACVSWKDTQAFIKWLNDETDGGYRLPSEAEFHYLTSRVLAKDIGSEKGICSHANTADMTLADEFFWANQKCSDKFRYTAPVDKIVGSSVVRVKNLIGNVTEWVQDCWHPSFGSLAPTTGVAWESDCDTGKRVVKGGSWYTRAGAALQENERGWHESSYRSSTIGFRLARSK